MAFGFAGMEGGGSRRGFSFGFWCEVLKPDSKLQDVPRREKQMEENEREEGRAFVGENTASLNMGWADWHLNLSL